MSTITAPVVAGATTPATTATNINARIAAVKSPRITIQIPPPQPHPFAMRTAGTPAATGSGVSSRLLETPLPPSVSVAGTPYMNPFSSMMYPTSGFMFKQFEGLKDFTFASAKSGLNVGEKSAFYIYEKFSKWSKKWFTHCFLFLVILLYSVAGAFMFVALEGPEQQRGIEFVREIKHNFSQNLHALAQDRKLTGNLAEWQGAVDRELQPFINNLTAAIKAGRFDADQETKPPIWSFWNAMFYCGTIYTTIGYGHIYPATNAGKALTIAYAIIGIPMFLILLADFGKLFTRGIKVLWRYVRRLYYTGSLRRVRKQAHVQEVLRGMNIAYEVATFRRPSMMVQREAAEAAAVAAAAAQQDLEQGGGGGGDHLNVSGGLGDETPVTPVPTDIDVDDEEFNLPISLALGLLVTYILCGAFVYTLWEDWTFFEASYFVFISMSTIGFGDYVPKHPIFMMASIVYLLFGLALTSMCINVVQVKLSDSFRQASAKISASMGMMMAQEAQAEEERKSMGAGATPGIGGGGEAVDGGGDWPQVHQHRPVATMKLTPPPPMVVVQEESAETMDEPRAKADEAGDRPPALPPKKTALVNEVRTTTTTAKQTDELAAEEVKKRRRFWK